MVREHPVALEALFGGFLLRIVFLVLQDFSVGAGMAVSDPVRKLGLVAAPAPTGHFENLPFVHPHFDVTVFAKVRPDTFDIGTERMQRTDGGTVAGFAIDIPMGRHRPVCARCLDLVALDAGLA